MLDVRRLRMLREVALRGSIAGAAESLGFTPAAVSQQIAKLEREAGVPLVERGPRSIRPNAAGRALVTHAEAILARLAEAEDEIRAIAGEGSGPFRVASFQSASATVVTKALRRFSAAEPDVAVTLGEADPEVGLARLRAGEADVAIVWEYDYVPAAPEPEVVRIRLLDDPVHVLLAADHAAADRPSVRLDELRDDAWITSTARSSCHPFTERACNAAGFEPRVSAETNDHHVMTRLVADGVGVALVTELSLPTVPDDVAVRRIVPISLKRSIFVAFRRASEANERVAAMVRLLEAAAAEQESALEDWRRRHLPGTDRGRLRIAGADAA